MKSFVLFNNKGGVGKTTLSFNLAHMMSRQGSRVVVIDCDPQCNLTAVFLDDDQLGELWAEDEPTEGITVAACVDLVRRGKGDLRPPRLREVADRLWLLPGHLGLGRFEQPLAEEWPKVFASDNERAVDVTTALDVLSNMAADEVEADIVLFDVGPSLGALNRATLLACDAVIIPVAPDLFSLQGLKNVGPSLIAWRNDWERVTSLSGFEKRRPQLPLHKFRPIGYLVQQHLARADRPVKAFENWARQIPEVFQQFVLDQAPEPGLTIENDPNCLGTLKHFASLAPYAHTARKPMFDLKQADGVGGGQIQSVAKCREDFRALSRRVLERLAVGP